MSERSEFLGSLDKQERAELEDRLLKRQTGRCFICEELIDLVLHQGQLDVDHIVPLAEDGADEENNFALVHASCNRSKGASDLRVARRMAEFERLQDEAKKRGERGANLGHLLARYGGAKASLQLKVSDDWVEFVFAETGEPKIQRARLYRDRMSGMRYFFTLFPLEYLHHDDRINPRSIGSNIRGLIEEFMKKRPQLHVALGWWAADEDRAGPVKVFDGQHKAAAQILLGVRELPLRVFIEPDTNVLLQANTNAADKLRQVAFDAAVMRHLGSTLFAERAREYQRQKGLREDDYSFTERDLVSFFMGERRQMLRYVIDAVRDSITHNKDNRLMEFVEWSGKSADRPMSYSAVEKTFFKEFLYGKALDTPLGEGVERGDNPRLLERDQMVRLMTLFADVFFVNQWDPDVGGRKLEDRLKKGQSIPEAHLRAWRVGREEVVACILEWVRLVMQNYFAYAGQMVDSDRILHTPIPETLWERIEHFLRNVAALPCWIDKPLGMTVFGIKQNPDFWRQVFKTGVSPTGVRVLAHPLDLAEMIKPKGGRAA